MCIRDSYYTVLGYILFGVTWLFFHWCQHHGFSNQESTSETAAGLDIDGETPGKKDEQTCYCCRLTCYVSTATKTADKGENGKCCCVALMISLCFAIFLLLGLVVVITCYFVLIPINKAISDAPNRILSVYQSGGFLIGSFIVYKVIAYFYSKKKEDKGKKSGKDDKASVNGK